MKEKPKRTAESLARYFSSTMSGPFPGTQREDIYAEALYWCVYYGEPNYIKVKRGVLDYIRKISGRRRKMWRGSEESIKFGKQVLYLAQEGLFGNNINYDSDSDPLLTDYNAKVTIELQAEIGLALSKLTPRIRRTVEMYLDGFILREIAEIEGVTDAAICIRMNIFRKHFQAAWDQMKE